MVDVWEGREITKPCVFISQLPVDYITTTVEDPIILNKWYTAAADLSGGQPAKLWYIQVMQTNTGVAVEDLELEITLPNPVTGVLTAYTWALGGVASAVLSYCMIQRTLAAGDFNTYDGIVAFTVGSGVIDADQSVPFVAGSVGLIRVRQTTAVDITAARIEVNVVWEKLTRIRSM